MLFRMYTRYCERKGWKVTVNDLQPGEADRPSTAPSSR